MSTILVEVYDALREAGASEEKARAAARAIAEHDARVGRIEAQTPQLATKSDLEALRLATKADLAELKADLLKWMLPFLAAQLLAMLALVARAYLPG